MANNNNSDPQLQYNQLIWEVKQLREDTELAGQLYVKKLERNAKRINKLNEQLSQLMKSLAKQNGEVIQQPVSAIPNYSYPQVQ